jgi:hypothetical protein
MANGDEQARLDGFENRKSERTFHRDGRIEARPQGPAGQWGRKPQNEPTGLKWGIRIMSASRPVIPLTTDAIMA